MAKAEDIMTKKVITISKDRTIYEAIDIMNANKISCVIVTEEDAPIGIVTERDIMERVIPKQLNPKKHKVSEIMTSPIIKGTPDLNIGALSTLMKQNRIRRMPIVSDNQLLGVVTETDIVSETRRLYLQNNRIMMHQNIQTVLIVICGILTAAILVYVLS